ncbi:MAG: helix-turn-helix transcriptional regulator [Acidimicrobiales bacterium]
MQSQGVDANDLAQLSPARIGELLRRARHDRALGPEYVARSARVGRRDVSRWERGRSRPTTDELVRLAGALGMSIDELIPPRTRVRYEPQTRTLILGDRTVAIVRRADDANGNSAVLRTYLGAVAASRGCLPGTPLALRRDDIAVLAQLLDLDDDDLEIRLQRLLGLSATDAAAVRSRLLSRSVTAVGTALVVGVLATGSLAAASAAGGHSDPSPTPTTSPSTSASVMVRPPTTTMTPITTIAVTSTAPDTTAVPEPPGAGAAAESPASTGTGTAEVDSHRISPVQLPDDADGDGIDIGTALVIERGAPPSDPGAQIGDAYSYER